jgi:hypothetical protein
LFRVKKNQITNINSAKGLFSDGVFCILEDDDGWFWMNSNQGIYRVKRDELNKFADGQVTSVNSVSYGPDDGLLNVEGNGGRQPAGLKASDGKLWPDCRWRSSDRSTKGNTQFARATDTH